MPFVFYDLETTGIDTRHDQILNFAAIRTNSELVVQERREFCCRVDHHLVPHPEALIVTRRTLAEVTEPKLPSHYNMMREVAQLIEAWSPATMIGFNSIRFDEPMLHHSLYRTLHNPYLTSWNGNVRADALTLCRSVAFFSPGVLTVPMDAQGSRRFALEQLAAANGVATGHVHSAIADAEATLALCRLIMERDGDCWSRFLQFAAKKSASALIDAGCAFGAVRFRGNEPHPVAAVGLCSPVGDANQRVCLDLSADFDHLSNLADPDLAVLLTAHGSPIFKLRVNACPSLCEIWDVPSDARPGLDDDTCDAKAERARLDPRLGARIAAVIEESSKPRVPAEHVEEQLYDKLPMREDDDLQRRFHAADWRERLEISKRFADPRSRQLGRRLVHLEARDVLDQATCARLDASVVERLTAPAASRPWTTVADAIAAVYALGDRCPAALANEFLALA